MHSSYFDLQSRLATLQGLLEEMKSETIEYPFSGRVHRRSESIVVIGQPDIIESRYGGQVETLRNSR